MPAVSADQKPPPQPDQIPHDVGLVILAEQIHRHAAAVFDHRYRIATLTATERAGHCLAELAYRAALSERALYGRWVCATEALNAGAGREQVARAMGLEPDELRAGLRSWAAGQRRFGLIDDAEHAEVLALIGELDTDTPTGRCIVSGGMARRWDHLRTSRIVLTGLWADAVLVMAASAWNSGLAFEALGQHLGEGIALGVAVDVGLAVSLIGDRALHLHGKPSHWGRALRIITAVMSLALNCGVQLWLGHYGVALFHAFLPVLLVLLSEYSQDTTLQFGEIAEEHAAAVRAGPAISADTSDSGAPVVATAPQVRVEPVQPVAPVRPDPVPVVRPDFAPAVRPTERPTDSTRTAPAQRPASARAERSSGTTRNGPPRKPRTDAQLSRAVRDMAQQTGAPPSVYALKQQFGIGSSRAARLLAELDSTPVGPPSSNGAATRAGAR
ncbi:MAG TPA: hypothetical protein VHH34_25515 [Pseudonocardiaceae bacterium]|nr:hypothetical protein [Pseudonocardiaceae bacterium]